MRSSLAYYIGAARAVAVGFALAIAGCQSADSTGLGTAATTRPLAGGPSTSPSFFGDHMGDKLPAAFRGHVAAPVGEKAVEVGVYPDMVSEFVAWLSAAIPEKNLPSTDFVAKNLRLFPSTITRPEDLAILEYRAAGTQYWIAQTGGVEGMLYVCASRCHPGKLETEAAAQRALEVEVAGLLNPELAQEMPPLTLEKVDGVWAGQAGRKDGKITKMSYSEFVITRDQVGFALNEGFITDRHPSREPLKNEWFRWVEQVEKDRKGN